MSDESAIQYWKTLNDYWKLFGNPECREKRSFYSVSLSKNNGTSERNILDKMVKDRFLKSLDPKTTH